jgi:hypothetical protein
LKLFKFKKKPKPPEEYPPHTTFSRNATWTRDHAHGSNQIARTSENWIVCNFCSTRIGDYISIDNGKANWVQIENHFKERHPIEWDQPNSLEYNEFMF